MVQWSSSNCITNYLVLSGAWVDMLLAASIKLSFEGIQEACLLCGGTCPIEQLISQNLDRPNYIGLLKCTEDLVVLIGIRPGGWVNLTERHCRVVLKEWMTVLGCCNLWILRFDAFILIFKFVASTQSYLKLGERMNEWMNVPYISESQNILNKTRFPHSLANTTPSQIHWTIPS